MKTYIATNTANGKFYIGSTKHWPKRKYDHIKSTCNYPFQNTLRQNPELFEWEVWEDDSDEPILEQALLDMWYGKECCYNLSSVATSLGPELCSHKGENHPQWGKEGTNKGKTWWVNAHNTERMSVICPGDGWIAGRSVTHATKVSKTLCGKNVGENHPMAKLTNSQRNEIASKGVKGFGGNVNQLAQEYGVTRRQILNILNAWRV